MNRPETELSPGQRVGGGSTGGPPTAFYEDAWLTVFGGDCRLVMAGMEPESVHCVVTSPPYWGLRDYGTTGQLGLEATPEEYVANLVDVFREVRRVLRNDGTVWLNLGDSYAAGRGGTMMPAETLAGGVSGQGAAATHRGRPQVPDNFNPNAPAKVYQPHRNAEAIGLKHKDLVGIPWRVAFALQADGWYLRSDIIWSKPNPMPESVTDRPTKSHEYLFLLSKSPRYYFDADAVREPHGREWWTESVGGPKIVPDRNDGGNRQGNGDPAGRNLRSVWTIATQPYPGAHFATFPRKLVEPCVKAGTSERGVCPECGAPWTRVVERTGATNNRERKDVGDFFPEKGGNPSGVRSLSGATYQRQREATDSWRLSCDCGTPRDYEAKAEIERAWKCRNEPVPATVLDPFAGSGTTGAVAQSLNRRAILIDLNADYLVQAMNRNRDIPLGLGAA